MTSSAIPVLSTNTDPHICPRQTKILSIIKMRGAGTHAVFAGPSSPLQNVIQDECLTLVLQNSETDLISLQSLYSALKLSYSELDCMNNFQNDYGSITNPTFSLRKTDNNKQ